MLLHQAAPKDGSCFRIRCHVIHKEKVIDLFGRNILKEKGVLRPSLFFFMHKVPPHKLYILSLNVSIAFARMETCDGHRLWNGQVSQQAPMRVVGEKMQFLILLCWTSTSFEGFVWLLGCSCFYQPQTFWWMRCNASSCLFIMVSLGAHHCIPLMRPHTPTWHRWSAVDW